MKMIVHKAMIIMNQLVLYLYDNYLSIFIMSNNFDLSKRQPAMLISTSKGKVDANQKDQYVY